MAQRVFQDAAGTIPAIFAGQRVGLIRRKAGTVDAIQTVLDDRPILARWPLSGRRNLLDLNVFDAIEVGRTETFASEGLVLPLTVGDGISGQVVGKGVEGGVGYVDVKYSGTNSAASDVILGLYWEGSVPATAGSAFTCSLYASVVSGLAPSPQIFIEFGPDQSEGVARVLPPAFSRVSATGVAGVEGPPATKCGLSLTAPAGGAVDCTIRIGGMQFERGEAPTPLQIVTDPNDITEPGVEDLWHIFNGGGDNLTLVLPPGTYGVAALAVDRSFRFDTLVSDGSTPIATITTEREVDAIYRLGAFSAAEQIAIQEYWDEAFPL